MKNLILTIDVGTGSARAALSDMTGSMLGFAAREYDQITPQAGWSEQPPSLWWQSVCHCTNKLMQQFAAERTHIAAVGVCGQMHGTVLLNAQGKLVIDQALLWNDKRSQPQVEAFLASNEYQQNTQTWLQHLNNPPAAAWPAFKLRWYQENHPTIWQQVAKVLMPKDYINFLLTEAYVTDYSEASCYFLMDSQSRKWSPHALTQFAINENQLPELANAWDIIGTITDNAARQTGLPSGIPVVAGTADMAASLLGSGVYTAGSASDSTGTSTLLTVLANQPLIDQHINNLHLANSVWGGFTILDAGGDAVRWVRLVLSHNQLSHNELLEQAAQIPAGAEGLFFLPYLTGERMAEKTNSRAQFFGLQRKHRQGHLFRAVLEGVTFACLRNLNQLRHCGQTPQQIIASGGGARSPLWLKIKASIYNLPVICTTNQENGVTGCAIIAGVGTGLYQDFADGVHKMVHFNQPVYPDARLTEYYAKCQPIFDTLYQQAQSLYDRLDALTF